MTGSGRPLALLLFALAVSSCCAEELPEVAPLIDLHFQEVPIAEALSELARQAHLTVIFEAEARLSDATVTLELSGVPWGIALEIFLSLHADDLEATMDAEGALHVIRMPATVDPLEESVAIYDVLEFAENRGAATALLKRARALLAPSASTATTPSVELRGRNLLVCATAEQHRQLAAWLADEGRASR